jgi:hypothetical protein
MNFFWLQYFVILQKQFEKRNGINNFAQQKNYHVCTTTMELKSNHVDKLN